MSSPDLTDLAWDLDVRRVRRARGRRPRGRPRGPRRTASVRVLVDVLADPAEPEVARLRAFGRIAVALDRRDLAGRRPRGRGASRRLPDDPATGSGQDGHWTRSNPSELADEAGDRPTGLEGVGVGAGIARRPRRPPGHPPVSPGPPRQSAGRSSQGKVEAMLAGPSLVGAGAVARRSAGSAAQRAVTTGSARQARARPRRQPSDGARRRRSGGTVVGGCWRGGSESQQLGRRLGDACRTASSKAASVAADTDCTPLTLRTYWRAAASISSAVRCRLEATEDRDVAAHVPSSHA